MRIKHSGRNILFVSDHGILHIHSITAWAKAYLIRLKKLIFWSFICIASRALSLFVLCKKNSHSYRMQITIIQWETFFSISSAFCLPYLHTFVCPCVPSCFFFKAKYDNVGFLEAKSWNTWSKMNSQLVIFPMKNLPNAFLYEIFSHNSYEHAHCKPCTL